MLLLNQPTRRWEREPIEARCLRCDWLCSGPVAWVDQAIANEANACDRPCSITSQFTGGAA